MCGYNIHSNWLYNIGKIEDEQNHTKTHSIHEILNNIIILPMFIYGYNYIFNVITHEICKTLVILECSMFTHQNYGSFNCFFLETCMSFLLCLTKDPAASASDSCIPLSLGPLPYFLVTLVCCHLIQYHDIHCLTCTVIELS